MRVAILNQMLESDIIAQQNRKNFENIRQEGSIASWISKKMWALWSVNLMKRFTWQRKPHFWEKMISFPTSEWDARIVMLGCWNISITHHPPSKSQHSPDKKWITHGTFINLIFIRYLTAFLIWRKTGTIDQKELKNLLTLQKQNRISESLNIFEQWKTDSNRSCLSLPSNILIFLLPHIPTGKLLSHQLPHHYLLNTFSISQSQHSTIGISWWKITQGLSKKWEVKCATI